MSTQKPGNGKLITNTTEEKKQTLLGANKKPPENPSWKNFFSAVGIVGTIASCTTIPAIVGAFLQPYIGFVNMLEITFPFTTALCIVFFIAPKLDWKKNYSLAYAQTLALLALTLTLLFDFSCSQGWGGITVYDNALINNQLIKIHSTFVYRWWQESIIFINFYFQKYGAVPFLCAIAGAIIIVWLINKLFE